MLAILVAAMVLVALLFGIGAVVLLTKLLRSEAAQSGAVPARGAGR